MTWIWPAVAMMAGAALACHMGLTEAVARILLKVAKCPKCCSFWTVLTALVLMGCDLTAAAVLSVIMAYSSHWFGILLHLMNELYDDVWVRLQRRRRRARRLLR